MGDKEISRIGNENKLHNEGEGPAVGNMREAWTGFYLHAESTSGSSEKCSFVCGDGYLETARMAVETAMTLRFEGDRLPFRGGRCRYCVLFRWPGGCWE